MKTNLLLICSLLVIGPGCVTSRDSVPVAMMKINPQTGQIETSNPKDLKLSGLHYRRNADGSVSLDLDSADSRMNPEVITMTGQAYVGQINAIGGAVAQGVSAALSGAATSGAAPALKMFAPAPQLKAP